MLASCTRLSTQDFASVALAPEHLIFSPAGMTSDSGALLHSAGSSPASHAGSFLQPAATTITTAPNIHRFVMTTVTLATRSPFPRFICAHVAAKWDDLG